ncbi:hypothetical protein SRABI06_04734 [Pseudomonas brassicacearum]|nr:type II toxin-antitoxin system RelE/ParE family toxin [Pseudomonas brassicacearum]CAH0305896.1 hypothetical protein SRABI06_04734 [Pseudomonas brassicacearum]
MPQYRISDAARTDIVDILRLSQALTLAALQAIADTPIALAATTAMSSLLIYSRQQAKQPHGVVKSPRHIVFYRVRDGDVIEIVRLLRDHETGN